MAGIQVPVEFVGDADGVFDDFDDETRKAMRRASATAGTEGAKVGKAGGEGAKRGFGSGLKDIGKIFAGSILADFGADAIRQAVGFLSGSVTQAADLGESINAVKVAFGGAADDILALGKNSAEAFGLSQAELNSFAVRFSGFAKNIAGQGGDVGGTFDKIAGRAADFASVFNISVDEAASVFQQGLAGETEGLKRFGIDLSDTAVQAFAMANGIGKGSKKLTEAQKQQARYGLLMQSTNKVAGDFGKTLGESLPNQQRLLDAQFKNLQATVGQAFIPILLELVKHLNSLLKPAMDWFVKNLPAIQAQFAAVGQGVAQFFAGFAASGQASSFITTLQTVALPALRTLGSAALQIAQIVLPMLQQAFATIAPKVQELVIALFPLIQAISAQLVPAFKTILPIVQVVFNTVVSVIGTAIDTIIQVVKFFTAVFTGDWKGALDAFVKGMNLSWKLVLQIVQGAGKLLLQVVMLLFGNLIRSAGAFFQGVGKAFRDGWNTAVATTKSILAGIAKGVGDAINTARSTAVSRLNDVKKAFTDAWNSAVSTAKSTLEGIGTAVSSAASTAYTNLTGLPGRLAGIFTGSSLYNAGYNLIGTLVTGIGKRIGDAVQKVKDGLAQIAGLLPGSPIKWGPLVSWNDGGAGKRLMEFLAEGIDSGAPEVTQAMTTATAALSTTPAQAASAGFTTNTVTNDNGVTVANNYYGPTTSGGRLSELDWLIRYATRGRTTTVEGFAT